MPRAITIVPKPPKLERKKRVAAYARVSSGKDAMLHSLSAQVSYYSDLIQNHEDWLYVGVYADEAKTGTKDSRADFQRLIEDCRVGKIDMVITKSTSRFARNTVTLLQTVRDFKSWEVDVFFEEQNIHTMSGDGELMMTILASYAQEESRSASENQKWRIKRNFEAGQPWNGALLGYQLKNGRYEIIPDEAELARRIYSDYLSGDGYLSIAKRLNEDGISSRFGAKWNQSVIGKILSNYTYTGNLILQKTFRENHITKKTIINNGKLPKYHAEDAHDAIIPLETWQAVQEEKARRAARFHKKPTPKKSYPFSGLLVCDNCGKNYRRKTTKTGIVWVCNTFNTQGKAAGKVHLPYKRFLGYEKGEDGRPTIVESEAEIVRLIYRLFLDGKSQAAICRELESLGIPSPGGKPTWSKTTVTSILQNEKYKGDALLQKKFTIDFLEKKMKPNEGEVPQYYVENSHPAIITPDEWDHVQAELTRRKSLGRAYSGKSVFSAKLVCEECGSFFGSKVWHSTDRYRRTIWQCNRKFSNEERCHTPTLDTETIQRLFIQAYNQLMSDRKQTIAEMIKAAVRENASTAQSQEVYLKKYEALTERYETAAKKLERLQIERAFRIQQDKKIALFIRTFKKLPDTMTEWDDTIWTVMVEKGIVHKDGRVTFVFKNIKVSS